MNKGDFVRVVTNEVAETFGKATLKDTAVYVDAVFNSIMKTLSEGEKISIAGFGVFDTLTRTAREGRNPKTGEAITIPESKSVKFKASSGFRDMVNE